MGFFRSLKGDHPDTVGGPSTSKPTYQHRNHELEPTYAPPPGPPPTYKGPSSSSNTMYDNRASVAPPIGAPPSYTNRDTSFGSIYNDQVDYAPPPGPPPSHQKTAEEPPPYHDWTSIPDTALLPPPPTLEHKASPTGNASLTDAIRAHRWCEANPLIKPHRPTNIEIARVKNGDIALVRPLEYVGSLSATSTGVWNGSTGVGSKDSCLITSLPLYFVVVDSPFHTKTAKTIYFEVKVLSFGPGRGNDASSLAVGFCAVPYPTWRMPGWERGSLAVHSDDGRRYVNDTEGGKDFTAPIQAGDTVGIGINFTIPDAPPDYGSSPVQSAPLKGEVFFTRNGRRENSWDLHEELDAETEFGILGLDGQYDLYGAIGTFGKVDFEACFNSSGWLWQPS